MKMLLFFVIIQLIVPVLLMAQTKTDSIEISKHWYGNRLLHEGKKVRTYRQLSKIIQQDPVATAIMKKAKTRSAIGAGINMAAIGYMTYNTYRVFAANKYYPEALYISYGIIALSIPFNISAGYKTKKAVRAYNEDLRSTGFHGFRPEYYLSIAPIAIGFTMKF